MLKFKELIRTMAKIAKGLGVSMEEILTKYGGNVSESPDPKKYDKLIQKWMMWDELIEQKKKSGEIK